MTVSEIIDEIFDNGLEIEIYKELSRRIIENYETLKNNNHHLKKINKIARKIAIENPDAKNAIEGIKALLED